MSRESSNQSMAHRALRLAGENADLLFAGYSEKYIEATPENRKRLAILNSASMIYAVSEDRYRLTESWRSSLLNADRKNRMFEAGDIGADFDRFRMLLDEFERQRIEGAETSADLIDELTDAIHALSYGIGSRIRKFRELIDSKYSHVRGIEAKRRQNRFAFDSAEALLALLNRLNDAEMSRRLEEWHARVFAGEYRLAILSRLSDWRTELHHSILTLGEFHHRFRQISEELAGFRAYARAMRETPEPDISLEPSDAECGILNAFAGFSLACGVNFDDPEHEESLERNARASDLLPERREKTRKAGKYDPKGLPERTDAPPHPLTHAAQLLRLHLEEHGGRVLAGTFYDGLPPELKINFSRLRFVEQINNTAHGLADTARGRIHSRAVAERAFPRGANYIVTDVELWTAA